MAFLSKGSIEFSSGIPVYRQIMNLVYCGIGDGSIREGDRLPTIKELAERFDVNPNTVAKAYRELDLKGVIKSRRGDGSYLSAASEGSNTLTGAQKEAKLEELFGRVIAEAKACAITEAEIMAHVTRRMREDE